MVGGLGAAGKGGRKGGYPSGPGHGVQHGGLPRPASVGDFNEADEENWNINQMPDYEVQAEFEKMLENMNLSGECLGKFRRTKKLVQGDQSKWLKPPVDFVLTVIAAGGPQL